MTASTKCLQTSGTQQTNVQNTSPRLLKEVAQTHGIGVAKLEHAQTTTPRLRSSKAKLVGRENSMPTLPTKETITLEKQKLIDSGELSIGEPCTPYALKKCTVNKDGNREFETVGLSGRKTPLTELRQTK